VWGGPSLFAIFSARPRTLRGEPRPHAASRERVSGLSLIYTTRQSNNISVQKQKEEEEEEEEEEWIDRKCVCVLSPVWWRDIQTTDSPHHFKKKEEEEVKVVVSVPPRARVMMTAAHFYRKFSFFIFWLEKKKKEKRPTADQSASDGRLLWGPCQTPRLNHFFFFFFDFKLGKSFGTHNYRTARNGSMWLCFSSPMAATVANLKQ
jgi:hypothetical protein